MVGRRVVKDYQWFSKLEVRQPYLTFFIEPEGVIKVEYQVRVMQLLSVQPVHGKRATPV